MVLVEVQQLLLGPDGSPTTDPACINEGFPLIGPAWDFNSHQGREKLKIYRQTLMGASRLPQGDPQI